MAKWCHYDAMNVTLKNVPADLHEKLRTAARDSGRSVNKLILHTLEREFRAQRSDVSAFLERIRLRRNDMRLWIDDASLETALEEGRS
jgi:EAL domain-containing protein (putative c-di-GMP-specific phosphodiesterase class I)